MERQQTIGVLLLFILLSIWWYINAPSSAEIQEQQKIQDSIANVQVDIDQNAVQEIIKEEPVLSDSLVAQQKVGQFGSLAALTSGTEESFVLENEKIKITFNNKGGQIASVQLKEHNRISEDERNKEIKHDLLLLDDPRNRFEYLLPIPGKASISTMDLYFDADQSRNEIEFKLKTEEGYSFSQVYKLVDDYTLDYSIVSTGFPIDQEKGLSLKWKNHLNKLEKNVNFEKLYSTVYYKPVDDDSDYCSCRSSDTEDLASESLEWISHTNQFF